MPLGMDTTHDLLSASGETVIYIGNNPFKGYNGSRKPTARYIEVLSLERHVITATDFKSGLDLVGRVKEAALWIIEVMISVPSDLPQEIKHEVMHGLAAGPYLANQVIQNAKGQVLLLAVCQPTHPEILGDLSDSLGDRGIAHNALALPPNILLQLVNGMIKK